MICRLLWVGVMLGAMMAALGGGAGGGRVFVPFAFEADGARLPAGYYTVEPGPGASVLVEGETSRTAVVASVDRYAAGCSCLRFHRYADDSYVLSDVHTGGRAPSLEVVSAIRKSRREFPMESVEVPLKAESH